MMMTHYRQPQRLNESSISLSPTLRENSSTVFADTFSTKVENSYTFIVKIEKAALRDAQSTDLDDWMHELTEIIMHLCT